MEKKSIYKSPVIQAFLQRLEKAKDTKILSEKYFHILKDFFLCYISSVEKRSDDNNFVSIFNTYLDLVIKELSHPYVFAPYHKKILSPFDYYHFGVEFLRPLVDEKHSQAYGLENVETMVSLIKKNHNVILLANHQIESDPQAISLLLEHSYPQFAKEIIFVAGERVIADPLAVPLSMGCDLLCIYSKKHISDIPELKSQKQLHNKKTMELMSKLLSEGGKTIYVALSGGRDRPNDKGVVELAPFDPQSLEMFYLMAKKSKQPTHFFTLALATYDLLPPPDTIETEMGESRITKHASIHLTFGSEVDMENFPGCDAKNKLENRKNRAQYIWDTVNTAYKKMTNSN